MAEEELEGEYSELKDLKISVDKRVVSGGGVVDGDDGFCLCFWMYLKGPIIPPAVIIEQTHSVSKNAAPFLSLNDEGMLTLFPFLLSHNQDLSTNKMVKESLSSSPAKTGRIDGRWIHICCKVSIGGISLHIKGESIGERSLSSILMIPEQVMLEGLSLAGNDGSDKRLEGYIHDLQIFPLSSHQIVADLASKNLPIMMSLDCSRVPDAVDEECSGVWNIVGGKASCRRKFSLDVALVDPSGRTVCKDFELAASLVYDDNGTTVRKALDSLEDPLLITQDGIEFASTERGIRLVDGQASIKLKISQLSSKCENRLFRVHIYSSGGQRYPFLEVHSPPIRCISRTRHSRGSVVQGRKRSHSAGENDVRQLSNESDSKSNCPSKNLNYFRDDSHARAEANENFQSMTINGGRFEANGGQEAVLSDSESTDARNSAFRQTISDAIVFKYCMEGTEERSLILRDVLSFACDEDIMYFAEQVSLFTGCYHHRRQILISKKLISEGDNSWRSISRDDNHVRWSDMVPEIDRKFRKLSRSTRRGLSGKDFEVLRRISGCSDDLGREDFDRMWHWLYPVLISLSMDHIRGLWESTSPVWIEGIITKEEAEASLKGIRGALEPGTFVLRFPTSRSWPHPDAGSLVVTYVGSDYLLHNRLLAVDNREMTQRPLQELLLEEPELTHLGRVVREALVL
ncbi:SH2 domain protein B [Wolffia australiana]